MIGGVISPGVVNAKSNSEIRKELKAAVVGKTFAFGNHNHLIYYLAPGGIAYFANGYSRIKRKTWGIKFYKGQFQVCVKTSGTTSNLIQCGSKAVMLKHKVGTGDVRNLTKLRALKRKK